MKYNKVNNIYDNNGGGLILSKPYNIREYRKITIDKYL